MRSRLLDIALILGLVVVAGGIMWTLFNLGTSPRPAATPSPTPPAAGAPAPASPGPTVTSPIAPVDPATADAPTPTTATPGGTGAPQPGDTAAAASGEPAVTPASPPPPRPVPPGTVALERIGFSYVTGGPGACGVVLEAWTHVAVSRDLLAAYGCGAEVRVTLDDPADGRSEVVGIIGDTMNPSFELTVNVYVGEDEDAFAYGLTTGTFTPR